MSVSFPFQVLSLSLSDNEPSLDMCEDDRHATLNMCPQCDQHCGFWQLKKSCVLSRFTYLFDNAGTVIFAFLMSFWGKGGERRNFSYCC